MTWFKVADGFSDHPKVRRIPKRHRLSAIGLWTLAGSWSACHLTNGHVPSYMLEEFGATEKDSAALVMVGLWDEDGAAGWVFHDWLTMQPSKDKVLADRAAWAERQRLARQRGKQKRADVAGTLEGEDRQDVSHADVTRDSHRDSHRDSRESPPVSHAHVTRESTSPVPSRLKDKPKPEAKTSNTPSTPLRSVEDAFTQFWAVYPRKVGKADAQRVWAKIAKTHDIGVIVKAAQVMAEDPNLPEQVFIPHPATWLHRAGWNDEPFPERGGPVNNQVATTDIRTAQAQALRAGAQAADKKDREIRAALRDARPKSLGGGPA